MSLRERTEGAGLDSGKVWDRRVLVGVKGEGCEGCSYTYNRVALDNRPGAKSFGTRRGWDRKI